MWHLKTWIIQSKHQIKVWVCQKKYFFHCGLYFCMCCYGCLMTISLNFLFFINESMIYSFFRMTESSNKHHSGWSCLMQGWRWQWFFILVWFIWIHNQHWPVVHSIRQCKEIKTNLQWVLVVKISHSENSVGMVTCQRKIYGRGFNIFRHTVFLKTICFDQLTGFKLFC